MSQAIQSAYGKKDGAKPEQAQIKLFIYNSPDFITFSRGNKERRYRNNHVHVKNQVNYIISRIRVINNDST